MQAAFASRAAPPLRAAAVFRLAVLLLPTFLLSLGWLRSTGQTSQLLLAGAGLQVLLAVYFVFYLRAWRRPFGPLVILPYVLALCWLWFGQEVLDAWYLPLARGLLLIVPLVVFAIQTLRDTGAVANRRARLMTQKLANQTNWPSDLTELRNLPEVKLLRDLIQHDATPALALLQHPRKQVRLVALYAMEFRKHYRHGQPELVLHVVQHGDDPDARAAAVLALARVEDRQLVEVLGEHLRDPAPPVRQAAAQALLAEAEERWGWIRHAVKRALSDNALQADGALRFDGPAFSDEAVADLTAWCGEKGSLGVRAALTLGLHYGRVLAEQPDPKVIQSLKQFLADPHAASALRIELAQRLKTIGELDPDTQQQLLNPANPAPLRLIAAEALLAQNNRHQQALEALRDIAKLPNREIALGTADVVQRCLGVDLGLALGQPLPPLHSRQAAEVTRRVMLWAGANQGDANVPQRPAVTGHGSGFEFRL